MDKTIITVALTGAQQGKEANPNLPIRPQEIIQQGYEAWQAGAAIIHIHARDAAGKATGDVAVFAEIVAGLRSRCDAVINLSAGGAIAGLPLAERLRSVVELKPEIASFSVGSAMVGRYDPVLRRWARDFTLCQSYADLEYIARTMLAAGTRPELEVYDLGMIRNALTLREMGLLAEPLYFNLVLGLQGQNPLPTPKNLIHLAESLPPGAVWLATGIGRSEFPVAAMAAVMGGHVRVGLEDNVYISRGVLAASNAQLVEKVAQLVRTLGREVASPAEARATLGLGTGSREMQG